MSNAYESNSDNTNPHIIESSNNKRLAVRIVSYNILSSKLASPRSYTTCDPQYLEKSSRLRRILHRIDEELNLNTQQKRNEEEKTNSPLLPVIFCLQEVSREWVNFFYKFFTERKYMFIPALYGQESNGFMGV